MYIKVCGMRLPEQIQELEAKVDFLGFIYYPGSSRCVVSAPNAARSRKVGVFVNETAPEILKIAERDHLDMVQLHGSEDPTFCRTIRAQFPVIKAFGIHPNFDFSQLEAYAASVDLFLFDTFCPSHGGSGQRFPWNLLQAYTGETPFFLSGGLAPHLLHDLLDFSHPRCIGLDLNSGFERAPGDKCIHTLLDFIHTYHVHYRVSETR